jgi:hypothetical protein
MHVAENAERRSEHRPQKPGETQAGALRMGVCQEFAGLPRIRRDFLHPPRRRRKYLYDNAL